MGIWEAEVLRVTEVQPATFLLRLGCPGIAREARPGQFYMVKVGPSLDPFLPRPFSWFRRPTPKGGSGLNKGDVIEFLFNVVGKGTSLLANVRAGHVVEVHGPLGNGWRWHRGIDALLIGGGVGAASLMSLLEELPPSARKKTTALIGSRSQGSLWVADQMAKRGVQVFTATEQGNSGFHGTVVELLQREGDQLIKPNTVVYACGPKGMLEKIAWWVLNKGVPCQVSLEVRMACGTGLCLGCAVKLASGGGYARACKDGPVFNVQEVDWGFAGG